MAKPIQASKNDQKNAIPTITARVCAARRGFYTLWDDQGTEIEAGLKTAAYRVPDENNPVPVVGDWVQAQRLGQDTRIVRTMPRSTAFYRSDFSGHALNYAKTIRAQAVAANFDDVFIVDSLNQNLSVRRIERYLVATRESGARPIIILTKADLEPNWQAARDQIKTRAGDALIYAVSAKTGQGLPEIRALLTPGRVIALLGSSGVGKSSLINALADQELMRVNAIREDDAKGRHTTTHRQLLRMPNGALCMDTPGMRELGMWDADEGLTQTFSHVEDLISKCRFSDCKHAAEPGCAVRAALQDGTLSQAELTEYMNLRSEINHARRHAPKRA